jgi:hypothetical protein
LPFSSFSCFLSPLMLKIPFIYQNLDFFFLDLWNLRLDYEFFFCLCNINPWCPITTCHNLLTT